MSAPGNVRKAATTRDDWETPQELFKRLNDEFDFTLDGAANKDNAKCSRYLSDEPTHVGSRNLGDAFEYQPEGETIWLNPPYGPGLTKWIRLASDWGWANRVVMLVPNATDTSWFRELVDAALEIRLLSPRVQFEGTTSSNPNGSVIAVIGKSSIWTRDRPCLIWSWRWKT